MIKLSDNEMKAILQTIPLDAGAENRFFEDIRFFPGRCFDSQTKKVIQPQESLNMYEMILSQISRIDPQRYATMHKGTPFYIMGWLAYEIKDYEKGVFYMDSALSEDFHTSPSEWITLPAASFIFLNKENKNVAAYNITIQARREVDFQLDRFSNETKINFDTETLVEKFFKPQSNDSSYRSIITSFLTFLLENADLHLQLKLRSSYGGTIEPFLTHLFKGGLILESLLKRKYSSSGNTLGSYLNEAQTDIELKNMLYKNSSPYKFEELPNLLEKWEKEKFHERAIAIAYAVRNTTGHDLAWKDVFTEEVYLKLFQEIMNALIWVIKKSYKI